MKDNNNNEFFRFWLWEYCRRSTEHNLKAFGDLQAGTEGSPYESSYNIRWEGDWTPQVSVKCFAFENWGNVKPSEDMYSDSSAILESLIDDSFVPHYPEKKHLDSSGLVRLIDSVSVIQEISNFQKYELRKQIPEIVEYLQSIARISRGDLYFIDMSLPLEELQKRLSYEYSRMNRQKDNSAGSLEEVIHKKRSGLKRTPLSSNGRRAIGLWIWDYILENKVTQKAAIKEWRSKYGAAEYEFNKDGLADDDFKKYYRRTKACIEASAVLSFDVKG